LDLAAVFDFFAGQLETVGWVEVDHQDTQGQQVTFWEFAGPSGTTWAAKLLVSTESTESPYTYNVELKLLQPR
jgi:hypothetical protein